MDVIFLQHQYSHLSGVTGKEQVWPLRQEYVRCCQNESETHNRCDTAFPRLQRVHSLCPPRRLHSLETAVANTHKSLLCLNVFWWILLCLQGGMNIKTKLSPLAAWPDLLQLCHFSLGRFQPWHWGLLCALGSLLGKLHALTWKSSACCSYHRGKCTGFCG